MTDLPQWQPPSGSARDTAPTHFDSPADAVTNERAERAPGGVDGAPSPGGWTPPPKPGLIPLRPLTLGTMLSAAFQVLRRNPRPMFGFSLLITGTVTVLSLVIFGAISFTAFNRTLDATGADADTIAAGSFATIMLAALVPIVLSLMLTAVLQGIVVLEVARGTVGEKLRLGGLWRAAKGRVGALIGWTLIVSAIAIVAIVIVSVVIALIVGFGGTAGLVVGILLGVAAMGAAVVAALWLGTRLSLVPSVLMIERLPLRQAISRAWSLTLGFFWKTLGIQLLVVVIVQVVASIITTPLSILLGLATTLINPNGDQTALIVGSVVLYLLTVIFALVFGAIAAVVQSATTGLIYIDIRMRKEGLDLELSKFVEARTAGRTDVPDPYLPRAAA